MLAMTQTTSPNDLQRQFGIDGLVRIEPGIGGLPRIAVTSPLAQCHVYLHGAHVTHFQPAGHDPVLFMSDRSWFEPGKPIRGGIPICLPWFADQTDIPRAPAHGFVRHMPWELTDVTAQKDGRVAATLRFATDDDTYELWPHHIEAVYRVDVGAALNVALEVTSRDSRPLQFTEALHTYFAVGDVRQVSITGLEQTEYIDKMAEMARTLQGDDPITFTCETDRIYVDTTTQCELTDPVLGRNIAVAKTGSHTTVVWNPWIAKAQRMPDFGDDEWPQMVCIETANAAEHVIQLASDETHTITASISVDG